MMNKMMQGMITLVILLPLQLIAQEEDWLTYYERSGYKETPRYGNTIEYCRKLADASPLLSYTSFGVSPQGRELPLLIANRDGNFDALSVKESGDLVLLVQACVHPGESEGKDAGLMFLRDIVINNDHRDLLENVTLLFIPIFNVDGHERFGPFNRINQNGPEEMGWRTTAQNLNLNRDFIKADTPEMRDWLSLFNVWLPDFFIDIHTTDGADYQYVSTYEVETGGNMDEALTGWTKDVFVPYFEDQMEREGLPVFPYVAFRRWHDPRSGLRKHVAGPRYSQGYTAVRNRVGLLIETHMLKDYRTRVTASYEQIRIVCQILEDEAEIIKDLNKKADDYVKTEAFRKHPLPVDWRSNGDSIMVEFRGVEYDIIESDLTGGDWFIYYKDKPAIFELPYFSKQEPVTSVSLPLAYLVPPQWSEVIERLELHGIKTYALENTEKLEVETYRFSEPEWASFPFEGRFRLQVKYEKANELMEFPKGTIVVPTDQRTARVIAHLLEPDAPDALIRWGFMNQIFEQKEYAETYVMEEMAREMFEKDPGLKEEFEKMKSENPGIAKNQWGQLNWVYQRSKYRDDQLNLYPVARIIDSGVLDIIRK